MCRNVQKRIGAHSSFERVFFFPAKLYQTGNKIHSFQSKYKSCRLRDSTQVLMNLLHMMKLRVMNLLDVGQPVQTGPKGQKDQKTNDPHYTIPYAICNYPESQLWFWCRKVKQNSIHSSCIGVAGGRRGSACNPTVGPCEAGEFGAA